MGKQLASQSFIGWIGEEKYKEMVKFILRYISELDLPIMRCASAAGGEQEQRGERRFSFFFPGTFR